MTQMNLEDIMLNEKGQSQEDKYSMTSFIQYLTVATFKEKW